LQRSDRIRPVKDLADSRERDAGRLVAEARARVEECERQLQQLQRYREDYLGGGGAALGTTDTVRLTNRGAFLDRLNEAMREQTARVAEAHDELARCTEAWRHSRIESTALGRAVDRFERDEQRDADRREQREQDELSMQRSVRPKT
jgi:flagellar FliJ protein